MSHQRTGPPGNTRLAPMRSPDRPATTQAAYQPTLTRLTPEQWRLLPFHFLEHATGVFGGQFVECVHILPLRLIDIVGIGQFTTIVDMFANLGTQILKVAGGALGHSAHDGGMTMTGDHVSGTQIGERPIKSFDPSVGIGTGKDWRHTFVKGDVACD